MKDFNPSSAYENDFYAWTVHNATLLRQKKFAEIDVDHIAEEIESMGRSEKNQLINRLAILIAHLLKWQYQSERRGSSWERTIKHQRHKVAKLLLDNPSLKHSLDNSFDEAYEAGVAIAADQMNKNELELPEACPFGLSETLDNAFFPE